jgi:protein-tyrosine kinase
MSEFFRALQQAERDRALREQNLREPGAPDDTARPTGVDVAASAAAAVDTEPPPVVPVSVIRDTFSEPVATRFEPQAVAEPTVEAVTAARPPREPAIEAPPLPEERARQARRRRAPDERATERAEPAEDVTADAHLVSLLDPAAFEAEQYRVLRHLVEHRRRVSQLTVIGVTSPGPSEGKTLTTLNLAGALAQNPGARVLIVELDLRHPSVDRRLGLPDAGDRGLTRAILARNLPLRALVRRHPQFNLSVLSAGYATSSPYELLSAPRLGELLDDARREFDCVVLDCPPVVPFPDCRVIGKAVDGFFIVVAADKTSRTMLEETLNVMDQDKVLGLVFNGDRRAAARYYGGVRPGGRGQRRRRDAEGERAALRLTRAGGERA